MKPYNHCDAGAELVLMLRRREVDRVASEGLKKRFYSVSLSLLEAQIGISSFARKSV